MRQPKSNPIAQHKAHQLAQDNLLELLVDKIGGSDLLSLMLEIYRRRAAKVPLKNVLQQYRRDRFVRPASVSATDIMALDALAYTLLPTGFEILELAPLCPLGTCSVLAPIDQNNVVTTIRNTEVCADSTNVLALEAACRRAELDARGSTLTKLCASQRLLRAQNFSGPATFAHFRVLALCTAGKSLGNFSAEYPALLEQLTFYLTLLQRSTTLGYQFERLWVELMPYSQTAFELCNNTLRTEITTQHTAVDVKVHAPTAPDINYYQDLRFHIFVTDVSHNSFMLGDGGFTPWTQKLLNNKKEFFLASGIGTERFIACCKHTVS